MMKKRNNNSQNQNGGKGRYRRNNQGRAPGAHDIGRRKKAAAAAREKYINMARDAINSGDRVKAENYFQHADHYSRVLNALAEEQETYTSQREKKRSEEKVIQEDTVADNENADETPECGDDEDRVAKNAGDNSAEGGMAAG